MEQIYQFFVLIFFTNELFSLINGIMVQTNKQRRESLQDIQKFAEEFKACQKTLLALGDENRQHLILEMMQMGECGGVRVGMITAKTNLSRPAVSHHLRILKDAGLIKMRREGTKNCYYFDADTEVMNRLLQMIAHAKSIMRNLPDRSGENDNWRE